MTNQSDELNQEAILMDEIQPVMTKERKIFVSNTSLHDPLNVDRCS